MNPDDQKTHRVVTADLQVQILQLLDAVESVEGLITARCDNLDERVTLQRQTFDLAFLELHDLRDTLGHLSELVRREINTRSIDTAPLKRPFLGRVRWFLRGAE